MQSRQTETAQTSHKTLPILEADKQRRPVPQRVWRKASQFSTKTHVTQTKHG